MRTQPINLTIMEKPKQKIRIKDIATLAGVSEGTVDRVLHKRGEVSAKSQEAVNRVLLEMNYSPNLLARSLASKKSYRFISLIPLHQPSDYWTIVEKGFEMAANDQLHHNVIIEKRYYNQFDAESFQKASRKVLKELPDALIIAPIFREETLNFTKELIARSIPFSFIDSMIEEADFVTYYGQNSYKSGYVAAKLLLNALPEQSQVIVIRTKRKGAASNQTLARNRGFVEYIEKHQLTNIELINVEMTENNDAQNINVLKELFTKHHSIQAAITFNSKVYRLAEYLKQLEKSNLHIIGYDLLDENVQYLKEGVITYLIAQRPDKQAYFTVRDLCAKLIFKQDITKINYMPIDILMNENIDDYAHFRE